MTVTPLYNPNDGQMPVIGLMSGSGTNLRKIIEHEDTLRREQGRPPYHLVAIVSDNPASNAQKIGDEFSIDVVVMNRREYYKKREKSLNDMGTRADFERELCGALVRYGAKVAAYGGYMAIATPVLVNAYLGVNVHPADLRVREADGSPKYTGDRAVLDAILAGEEQLRSTTHIIAEQVDRGQILMVSNPLAVVRGRQFDQAVTERDQKYLKDVASANQGMLKNVGDWDIFPLTLQLIAEGRYGRDETGKLYFDGRPIPQGIMREELTFQKGKWELS